MPPKTRCRKPIYGPSPSSIRYKPTGKFSSWLTRVALNEALMMRRRERGDMVSIDEIGEELVSPDRPHPNRKPRINSSKRRMRARS